MYNVLILGKGFIGNSLFEHLSNKVFNLSLFSKKELDYTNEDVLDKHLLSLQKRNLPDIIINASGYTGVPNVDACESDKDNCFKYNVNVPLSIVRVANKHKIPVIHIGSGCIYSGYEKEYSEEDIPDFGLYNPNSSFYSKCKHISEMVLDQSVVYIFRIRIPFEAKPSRKNYLTKLLNYDKLINCKNSITSVSDLCVFTEKFIAIHKTLPGGIYNVVNEGSVTAEQVVDILKKYGLENKNWEYIKVSDLNTIAQRSNCVLSTEKIRNFNIQLPNAIESIERDIKKYSELLS